MLEALCRLLEKKRLNSKQKPSSKIKSTMISALSDFVGKYVVFFFYPLDFTFVCPTELHAFQEKLKEFEKRNAQVVGCSVDSCFSHHAWLNYP